MIYRAKYVTQSGTERRMTFSHSGGIKAAYAFAQSWQIRDERLEYVEWVREAQRPVLELQAQ